MMKWKARTETLSIGSMELNNLVFNEDYLEVCIDIVSISDELKTEVNKAIEIEKVRYTEDWERTYSNHPDWQKSNTTWSSNPVSVNSYYLQITLQAEQPIDYKIVASFHDVDDSWLDTCAIISVDLSAYEEELKKEVIKVLIDRFF